MKKLKKLLSLLTVLSMVAIMFSVVPVQVSAAPGDVVTDVRYTGTEWKNNLNSVDGVANGNCPNSKISLTTSTATYTVASDTNSGTSIWQRYFLVYKNGYGSVMYLESNSRYRVSFLVSAQGTNCTIDKYAAQLTYMEYNAGTFPALSSDSVITDLAPYAEQIAWAADDNGYNKYRITLTYDTPSVTRALLALSVFHNPNQSKPIYISEIKWEQLYSYNVVDTETSASIGTLWGMPGDDVQTLLTAQGFARSGYTMSTDIDTTTASTTTVNVTYTLIPVYNVQEIDFSDSYGQKDDSGYPTWHYIPSDSSVRHIELVNGQIKHDTSTEKGAIGQHSVTLANSFYSSGLEAGATYRVTFKLKTFPHWTPLESLAADIRFGEDIWTNVIDSATISLTGEDLAAAVTAYSPSSSGSVTFTISLDVTLPETGWGPNANRKNILLGIWGGEYWLDDVTISTTAQFEVQDESGSHLGYAYGHLGDSTAKIVNGESFVDAYHTFTLSPATVTAYNDVITLTKSLKSNIVDVIDFTTTDYPGNTEAGSGNYYSKDETNKKMIYTGSALKGDGVNVGNTFGFRSFVVSNNRADSGLEAGGTYRVALKFSSWYQPSTFGLQVGFGSSVWSVDMNSYRQTYTGDALLGKLVTERALSGTQSGIYTLNIDVTLPEAAAWDGYTTNKNVIVSLYGIGSNNIEYFLSKAYIYSPTEITFNSYDGTVNATATGFEGDTVTEVFDSANNAKLTNFSETFGAADKTVSAGNYKTIKRGDSDGDGRVNDLDIVLLRKYLLYGVTFAVDTFGANANALTFTDADIDIKDLVRIKSILMTPASSEPIAGLAKTGYKLAWSYEFNDSAVDSDYFGVQYGMAHSSSSSDVVDSYNYVGTGDKKCSYVKDGALVLSPDGNYGAGNPFICEPYVTKDKMHFTYGYLEINAKIPFGSGSFPALWLKSEKDASDNVYEIDLVETLGSTNNIAVNLHYWDGGTTDHNANGVSGRNYNLGATINEFHKFGFEWYKEGGVSYIAFYVDGNHVKTLSKDNIGYNADFDKEMYLMLENFPITSEFLSENSSWLPYANAATVSDYPMDMCIDYVRLYQTESNSGNTLDTFD